MLFGLLHGIQATSRQPLGNLQATTPSTHTTYPEQTAKLTLTNEYGSKCLAWNGERHRPTEPSDVIRQSLERPEDARNEENQQKKSWRARRGKVYD